MRRAFFTLHISAAEMLRYYRGSAATVAVTAEDGTRLRFPAANLRRFVSAEGVHGRFEVRFDEANRLLSIERR
ncbi:hypothetical protein DESUT3_05420 [Desulfuromonas versatilis]|uniref:DUF2835 domain-containing protein n=1 Tax=Desulfuromonas versatilis TaxID=2802975 RepID=A0ABN6DTL9_9BACT|nr:DUF2835 domain-containing protein [Desulfuromonas versatilis]BCR03473.1 hypothetical protein DESUT3_05420 [Desulfuromonas versatilis]